MTAIRAAAQPHKPDKRPYTAVGARNDASPESKRLK